MPRSLIRRPDLWDTTGGLEGHRERMTTSFANHCHAVGDLVEDREPPPTQPGHARRGTITRTLDPSDKVAIDTDRVEVAWEDGTCTTTRARDLLPADWRTRILQTPTRVLPDRQEDTAAQLRRVTAGAVHLHHGRTADRRQHFALSANPEPPRLADAEWKDRAHAVRTLRKLSSWYGAPEKQIEKHMSFKSFRREWLSAVERSGLTEHGMPSARPYRAATKLLSLVIMPLAILTGLTMFVTGTLVVAAVVATIVLTACMPLVALGFLDAIALEKQMSWLLLDGSEIAARLTTLPEPVDLPHGWQAAADDGDILLCPPSTAAILECPLKSLKEATATSDPEPDIVNAVWDLAAKHMELVRLVDLRTELLEELPDKQMALLEGVGDSDAAAIKQLRADHGRRITQADGAVRQAERHLVEEARAAGLREARAAAAGIRAKYELGGI